MICILCSSDLEFFSKYRYVVLETARKKWSSFFAPSFSILERQKKLYKARLQQDDVRIEEFQKFRVKEELFEEFEPEDVFIDCSTYVSNDEKTAAKKSEQLKLDDNQEILMESKHLFKPKKECGTIVKDWRRHMSKVHLNIKNFFCDMCSYGAFFKYDLGKFPCTLLRCIVIALSPRRTSYEESPHQET